MPTSPVLTAEDVATLEPGDVVQAGALFAGVCNEEMGFTVSEVSDKGIVTFDVDFMGAYMCAVSCKSQGGKLVWHQHNK